MTWFCNCNVDGVTEEMEDDELTCRECGRSKNAT